ncbi:MAG: threonyl-tRNA synthetase editing domain-containing protein [Candidatus Thorarchaeota archaeon]|jgi:hypothetical protein
MRLLMFHVEHFWFRPNESTEEAALDFAEALLVWIQSEEKDEADRAAVLRKMVKNIRWLAQKVGTSTVDALIDEAALRLRDREYVVHIVPFGAFHEFKMHVKGPSLAKVFKSF